MTTLTLRPMQATEIVLVERWLRDPDVARWYLVGSSLNDEITELRRCVLGDEPTEVFLVAKKATPIGWCQWYRCWDYPEHADGVGAEPDDIGIDYAIGDSTQRGRGVGTQLIATLVSTIRQHHPLAGIIADPETSNVASRRVLEKSGFQLIAERSLATEPTDNPVAIYRLSVHRAEVSPEPRGR